MSFVFTVTSANGSQDVLLSGITDEQRACLIRDAIAKIPEGLPLPPLDLLYYIEKVRTTKRADTIPGFDKFRDSFKGSNDMIPLICVMGGGTTHYFEFRPGRVVKTDPPTIFAVNDTDDGSANLITHIHTGAQLGAYKNVTRARQVAKELVDNTVEKQVLYQKDIRAVLKALPENSGFYCKAMQHEEKFCTYLEWAASNKI